MVWSIENSQCDEASKIRWECVPYFHGRVLDVGCGKFKIFPHWIGVDNGGVWGKHHADVPIENAQSLDLFAGQSCDGIFSSHFIEHVPYEMLPKMLTDWCRVIKQNGHLMLYVPDEDQYPKIGQPYSNPDHKWDCNYDKVVKAMESVPRGWDLIDFQKRSEDDEYSLWFVFKLTHGKERRMSWKLPKPEKTCAVVRYGAFGDCIQASSILPWLKSQGYHITFYCSDHGYPVIQHDPNIDRFILQGRDEVPPQFLHEFWEYTKKKYDKWINLSESVEGTLLAMAGRANHSWPDSVKAKVMDRNYIEFTHDLAEVPPPYQPKFYSTLEERAWARKQANQFGRRNILWSLSGSSVHKTWPHLDAIIARTLLTYPDVHFVLVGDEMSQILEAGWEKEKRVHLRSGKWSIRESMAFAEVAGLIIGTETGLLNAAGSMETPKIVTLSHSSEEMLTKHWKNTISLSQPKGGGCPKQPCRMLHFNWDHCMKHETGTALCQFEIGPEQMWEAVTQVLENRKAA
jgi:ADP-heptose:LPS heptosyltransferase/predicted SAM-dependent methyltransferase